MAVTTGPAPDPLSALQPLLQEPFAFDFFEAMRRIECAWPDAPRLGTATRPVDEPVRLGQTASLAFPASMLSSIVVGDAGRLKINALFFGLFGPNGPLPLHLTDYVHDRVINDGDTTLQAFSDLFHHRMLSLFYRAWASARPVVHFDRPESDRFATYVASLIGLGSPALRNRDAWPDRAKLFFAGTLAGATRTRTGLESMLREYLQLPVRVEECVGEWLTIADDERARLGRPATGTLGRAVLGARVWSVQHKVRIVLGPFDTQGLQRYLPGRHSLRRLRDAVRNYLGLEYAWDLQLVVQRTAVSGAQLGRFGQLGWTTWASPSPVAGEAGDVIINVCDDAVSVRMRESFDG